MFQRVKKLNRLLKTAKSSVKVAKFKAPANHGCRGSLLAATKIIRSSIDLKQLVIPGWVIIRNYNLSNDNLAILDSYKTIFKMSATENYRKQNR